MAELTHKKAKITFKNEMIATKKAKTSSADVEEYKKWKMKLEEANKELKRLNKFMVGRELKMAKLKKELDKLIENNPTGSSTNKNKSAK